MRPKGLEKTGGRQKGTPNKLTKTFKELLARTINELELDGPTFMDWAKENPTEFYKIAARLIPTELTGDIPWMMPETIIFEVNGKQSVNRENGKRVEDSSVTVIPPDRQLDQEDKVQ